MTARKNRLTITVDAEIADQVRAQVACGTAPSVSAYIEHAVRSQLAADADFDVLLAAMLERSGGPLTPCERAEAQRVLSEHAVA